MRILCAFGIDRHLRPQNHVLHIFFNPPEHLIKKSLSKFLLFAELLFRANKNFN